MGNLNLLPEGHELGKAELLFEKIEDEVIEKQVQKLLDTKKANEEKEYKAKPIKENIVFDDFTKLDIRVGTVLECEKYPKPTNYSASCSTTESANAPFFQALPPTIQI